MVVEQELVAGDAVVAQVVPVIAADHPVRVVPGAQVLDGLGGDSIMGSPPSGEFCYCVAR